MFQPYSLVIATKGSQRGLGVPFGSHMYPVNSAELCQLLPVESTAPGTWGWEGSQYMKSGSALGTMPSFSPAILSHLESSLSPWATAPSWPPICHLPNEQVRL